jgi:homogentisate 1,2-dioxygenase
MPVYRQGDVPHPPTGVPEHSDEVYTQKGFFGDWVHLYRRHNAGIPKRWSSDDIMFAGIDTNVIEPSDLRDADGAPVCLLEGDGIRVLLSRRSQSMPFCEKNTDYNQIRFYHRGEFAVDTELGPLTASPGDFIVVGKGLVFRERPSTDDNVVLIFEVADEIMCADEGMWDAVGFVSMFVDFSNMVLPTPGDGSGSDVETDVRAWIDGAYHTLTYDFDPCSDVTGWVGDPVIFKMNVWDVPAPGTSRGFLPPPAHAVLMSENKSFFFNVLVPPPSPTQPAPDGSFGAPAHQNDYDEVWFNHASDFLPHNVGHLWLFPRTLPHPGFKRAPSHPPNPVQRYREIKINFDTKAKLYPTSEARQASIEGDVRRNVFLSLYGMPPEVVDVRIPGDEPAS